MTALNKTALKSSGSPRRVLIIGSDGMRPDAITPELMPTYSRLIREGVLFNRFYSSFPSETRVSMTTLTTGVYPGKHGIVANFPYLPGFGENGFLNTRNHQCLTACEAQIKEPLVLRPTLGDRLHAAGKRLAVAGSGSPGSSLLWNIRHPQTVFNPKTDYGIPELEEIHRRLNSSPEDDVVERAMKAFLEGHLPDTRNEVLVFWNFQPDKVSHQCDIGSPEFREELRRVDACLNRLLEALRARGEEMNLLLISDHGHTTFTAQGPLCDFLGSACRELGIDETLFAVSGLSIFDLGEVSEEALQKLIGWFKNQPWCGAVFARHARAEALGALPVELLFGPLRHRRAPLLIINPFWLPQPNEYGVPGLSLIPVQHTPKKATHGNAVPTDMNAFCLGWGPDFRSGVVSDLPCGIVDIAPTVCHLAGLDGETGFDGRVLHEALRESPSTAPLQSRFFTEGKGAQRQPLGMAEVGGTRYIVGSESAAPERQADLK